MSIKLRQLLEEALNPNSEYESDFIDDNFPGVEYEIIIESTDPTAIRWDHQNNKVVLE